MVARELPRRHHDMRGVAVKAKSERDRSALGGRAICDCRRRRLQLHADNFPTTLGNADQFPFERDSLAVAVGLEFVASGLEADFLQTGAGDDDAAVSLDGY